MKIEGTLTLGEGIADGDVTLKGVEVVGQTTIRGGGENSIHFEDSVLATVIVNKNDGKIRIVAKGSTQIIEVQLESPAKLEETGLTGGSTGFEDVNIGDSVQTTGDLQVELIGAFETINSRATQVRINLPTSTSIRDIVLNAVAQVIGTGTINTATINAYGSTISSRPQNVVLNASSVSIRDEQGNQETVDSSYSDPTITSVEITGIELDMTSIRVNMDKFMAGLTKQDFTVSATLDGAPYELQGLSYNANTRRFTFNAIEPTVDNMGKTLKVTVSSNSNKLTGTAQTAEIALKSGFSGRITDVQGVGISNITLKFRKGANAKEGEVVATAVTDRDGYYVVSVDPGEYTGEISGSGVLTTYLYATALSDRFNTDQNETAIRATAMDSVKIVLTWGEQPRDEDSHLEGPTTDGGRFHTWYGDKIHQKDGVRYVDLDWDDMDSYGPETTTIYKLVDGTYKFYIHNYSGDAPLVGSGAKVEIYKGNESRPSETFEIPNAESSADGLYWMVFDMIVENENVIRVDGINKLVGIRPQFEINGQRYDNAWNNNFNSDTPITEENPVTITIPNAEGQKIYYSIGNTGEPQLYTGPFEVTSPAYVFAYGTVEGITNGEFSSGIEITDPTSLEPELPDFSGQLADAQQAVSSLFTDDTKAALEEGIDQAAITAASEKVAALAAEVAEKSQLEADIQVAQGLLDEALAVKALSEAQQAVSSLFTDDTKEALVEGIDQEAITAASDKVEALADSVTEKAGLLEDIIKATSLLNV